MCGLFRREERRQQFQEFFDSHLICAIDTVSVTIQKNLYLSEHVRGFRKLVRVFLKELSSKHEGEKRVLYEVFILES